MNLLGEQLKKYRDRLLNLTPRNKELYFRASKGAGINLTQLHQYFNLEKSKDKDLNVDQATQKKLEALTEPIRLSSQVLSEFLSKDTLHVNKYLNKKGKLQDVLEKKLKKLRLEDRAFQKEYGLSGAWFLGPFLCWRQHTRSHIYRPAVTPILKCPINLDQKNGNWTISLENDRLNINPTLIYALKKEWGVDIQKANELESLPEIISFLQDALAKSGIELEHCGEQLDDVLPRPKLYESVIDEATGEKIQKPVSPESSLNEEQIAIFKSITEKHFILVDAFYVDLISASSLPLYVDFETILGQASEHPALAELFGPPPSQPRQIKAPEVGALDSIYKEADNQFVVDIDSSQHRAVSAAKEPGSMVLVGPPGTGKSQTITNLIADALANNQTVLFVAEKRAALDVVYERLKKSKLGDSCLVVHGASVNYSETYKQILENTRKRQSQGDEEGRADTCSKLDRLKGKLRSYQDQLTTKHQPSGLSISELFSLSAQFTETQIDTEIAATFAKFKYSLLKQLTDDLAPISEILSRVVGVHKNPWVRLSNLSNADDIEVGQIVQSTSSISNDLQKLNDLRLKLIKLSQTHGIDYIKALMLSIEKAQNYLSQAESLQGSNLFELVVRFSKSRDRLENSLAKIRRDIITLHEKFESFKSIHHVGDVNLIKEVHDYFAFTHQAWSIFAPKYWEMRKKFRYVLGSMTGIPKEQALKLLKDYLLYSQTWKNTFKILSELGLSSELGLLELNELVRLHEEMINHSRIHAIAIELAEALGWKKEISTAAEMKVFNGFIRDQILLLIEFQNIKPAMEAVLIALDSKFEGLAKIVGDWKEDPTALSVWIADLAKHKDTVAILSSASTRLQKIERELGVTGICSVVIENLTKHNDSWDQVIISSTLQVWKNDLLRNNTVLKEFSSDQYARDVIKFQTLLDEHQEIAQQYVSGTCLKGLTSKLSTVGTAIAAVEKESNKVRRVKPLRELFDQGHGRLLIASKPCWLMNPLAISQFLPNTMGLFDLVIFDEASQVKVEEAVPSIYRGKKVVVVGDPKQMPPTNFFGGSNEDDDDDAETSGLEIEQSVLDLALLRFPQIMLSWHYRSRDEALIAFSNRAFYSGSLIAPPNPKMIAADPRPYSFHRLNGVFDSKVGNREEAKAIANHLREYLNGDRCHTMGVIAFGEMQQRAIMDSLTELFEKEPDLERKYLEAFERTEDGADVGLFIKNLENVQGDERDIIILSVGYAASKPGGALRKHFGPLTISGGERRLNVAITRAKKHMTVFCSFDPSEIPSDAEAFTKNRGNALLSKFLQYSKAIAEGSSELAMALLDSMGSTGTMDSRRGINRFEADVKRVLESHGFSVDAQIGANGFYIDLAIKHPSVPGNYVLGVECDGAVFHSSPYARERDKVRQKLLEERGWNIHRIWSQDWSQKRSDEINKLVNIANLALKKNDEIPTQSSVKSPGGQFGI